MENGPFIDVLPIKIVICNSYVSLPEGSLPHRDNRRPKMEWTPARNEAEGRDWESQSVGRPGPTGPAVSLARNLSGAGQLLDP